MSQSTIIAGIVAVALFLALLLAAVGGFGLTTTTSVSDPIVRDGPPIDPPADGSYGVVLGTHQSSPGFSVFGWRLQQPRFKASIAIVPPAGCIPSDSGPIDRDGPCGGMPIDGEISGGGTTAGGLEFVIVSVPVSRDCLEALAYGDTWPTTRIECQ